LHTNDSDPDSDHLTPSLSTMWITETLFLNPDGTFHTRRTSRSSASTASRTGRATRKLESAEVTVTLTVNKNTPPVAADDGAYTLNEETTFYAWDPQGFWDSDPNNDGCCSPNDTDVNPGQFLTAVWSTGPAHGDVAPELRWHVPVHAGRRLPRCRHVHLQGQRRAWRIRNVATVTLNVIGNASEVTVTPNPCHFWGERAVHQPRPNANDKIEIKTPSARPAATRSR
jgi:hypothetical protein